MSYNGSEIDKGVHWTAKRTSCKGHVVATCQPRDPAEYDCLVRRKGRHSIGNRWCVIGVAKSFIEMVSACCGCEIELWEMNVAEAKVTRFSQVMRLGFY